ncbi:MAG: PTS sugar transporter subunit IIB, partial [[Clostridium] innocuum]
MEGIVHVRIDDRMIHGQVAVFWSNNFRVNRIMVANDALENDEIT